MTTLALIIERLARLADPWQRLVSNSSTLSLALLFAHLGALLAGGGLALAADRSTWRSARQSTEERRRLMADLALVHRPVVTALAIAFASGGLLFLADVEVFAVSRVFWTKMGLIALLLGNGLVMTRLENSISAPDSVKRDKHEIDRLWKRRRVSAMASAALWYSVLLAGAVLATL